MKGVILAGGKGTRLDPLTRVTNKHLLPVYNKPVIYYGIEKLVEAGIDRIMIVTSPHHLDDFVQLLGSGQYFISKRTGKQVQIVYGIQNEAFGIAHGLYIAKEYVGSENCILYLGDNIIEDDITSYVRNFREGATIFLKEVKDPERFGVATVAKNGLVTNITEKPKKPKSNLAVVGVYLFDNTVFDKMIDQPTSPRGEKEITYINNKYLKEKKLKAITLQSKWFDIGTVESLLNASIYMSDKERKRDQNRRHQRTRPNKR